VKCERVWGVKGFVDIVRDVTPDFNCVSAEIEPHATNTAANALHCFGQRKMRRLTTHRYSLDLEIDACLLRSALCGYLEVAVELRNYHVVPDHILLGCTSQNEFKAADDVRDSHIHLHVGQAKNAESDSCKEIGIWFRF